MKNNSSVGRALTAIVASVVLGGCAATSSLVPYEPSPSHVSDPGPLIVNLLQTQQDPPLKVEAAKEYIKAVYPGPRIESVRFDRIGGIKIYRREDRFFVLVLDVGGKDAFGCYTTTLSDAQQFADAMLAITKLPARNEPPQTGATL